MSSLFKNCTRLGPMLSPITDSLAKWRQSHAFSANSHALSHAISHAIFEHSQGFWVVFGSFEGTLGSVILGVFWSLLKNSGLMIFSFVGVC